MLRDFYAPYMASLYSVSRSNLYALVYYYYVLEAELILITTLHKNCDDRRLASL